MPVHIVVLKSKTDENDVLHRLQTRALYQGLQEMGIGSSIVYLDGEPKEIPSPSHIVFGYRDREAALASKHIKAKTRCKVLCFISDVYDLAYFVKLSEFVDCFLAPSPLHRDVVQSAIVGSVVYVPESFDPISLPQVAGEDMLEVTNQFCWFGYPESFSKSMRFLLPQAFDLSRFDKNRFKIITSKGAVLQRDIEHRIFDAVTFYSETVDINFAVLSHFCYDEKLNTFIKSPNKMIASIVRGIVPFVSSTPSYREIAKKYNLVELLFRSPNELAVRMRHADFARDSERLGISAVRADLMKSHSPVNVARRVLDIRLF